jgi:hypothetical protein
VQGEVKLFAVIVPVKSVRPSRFSVVLLTKQDVQKHRYCINMNPINIYEEWKF